MLSGITALASTAFLMRYFRDHDSWALNPFAYYCLAAGLISLGLLLLTAVLVVPVALVTARTLSRPIERTSEMAQRVAAVWTILDEEWRAQRTVWGARIH